MMMPGSSARRANVVGPFQAFFQDWQVREQHYLDELLIAQSRIHECQDEYLKDLIARVLSHYEQYYEEKSKVIQQNVMTLFTPRWLTAFENTFLWITGFRPGLVCKLAEKLDDLSADQKESVNKLMNETKMEESDINDEFASIQESLAVPPVLELAREAGRRYLSRGGDPGAVIPESLTEKLEQIVIAADSLRTHTVLRIVGMLSPAQNVKFLTAAFELQIKIKTVGQQHNPGELHENGA